jgi:hypothetical protein
MDIADFGFSISALFREIMGVIARKIRERQVSKDTFSAR